jgi:hypothetical protein
MIRKSLSSLRRISKYRFTKNEYTFPEYIKETTTWSEKLDKLNLTPFEDYIMIGKHMEKPFTGNDYLPFSMKSLISINKR